MNTKRTTYCFLAALSAVAAAQETAAPATPAAPRHGIRIEKIAGSPAEVRSIEMAEAGHPGAIGGGVMIGGAGGAPGMPGAGGGGVAFGTATLASPDGVQAFEATQLGEPIRWAIRGHSDIFDQVIRPGPVTYLGVSPMPVPRELAVHLPLPEDTGLAVEGVGDDSPAAKAGLQKSDVLMKLDDQILIHPRQLSVLVMNKKEGETVKLTYLRKGEVKEVSVTLGKRDTPEEGKGVFLNSFSGDAPLRTYMRTFELPAPDGAPGMPPHAELELRKVKEKLALQSKNFEKAAQGQALSDEDKQRSDLKLSMEVRRAAEAAHAAELHNALQQEMKKVIEDQKAALQKQAADLDTKAEIQDLKQKLEAVLKMLEEQKK